MGAKQNFAPIPYKLIYCFVDDVRRRNAPDFLQMKCLPTPPRALIPSSILPLDDRY